MMFPLGVAKSSQTGPGPHRSANRSGVVAGGAVVEPGGEVVSVCVPVEPGVVTVAVAAVVAVEPLDPPQAVVANTAARVATLSHLLGCSRPMAETVLAYKGFGPVLFTNRCQPEHGDGATRDDDGERLACSGMRDRFAGVLCLDGYRIEIIGRA
jgi:hypothetical protein